MSTEKIKPGEVVGSALEIYREQAGVLLPAAIAVFAIVAIGRLVFTGGAVALVSLVALVVGTFYQGMVVELVRDIQDGRRDSSVEQLFRSVAPVVLPLIGLSILLGIGVTIGFILIIIPGLFLITIWSVAAPSLVIERHGVFAAFGRSRELVRGHGWPVFGVILVVVALTIVVGLIVAIIASGLGTVGVAIAQWILDILLAPFTALISAVLYFSLRRLHEGDRALTEPPAGDAPPSAFG
ncbi:MAG TPA: YciC family protein [Solirubrobacteraceae bacterium]|jgi:hypothetical protein|nr:YciC family protein [Solirubrobacteraceae bacterium]